MKLFPSLVTAFLLSSTVAVFAVDFAPQYLKPQEAKIRASHTELAQRQAKEKRDAAERSDVIQVEPGTLRQPKPAAERKGIVQRSTILCAGNIWTIVPKGSVLHVPAAYAARVDGKRTGKLVPWQQFHEQNSGWIRTYPVSIQQARGEVAVTPEQVSGYKRTGRIVISVCHKGPISMIPYREPEAAEGEGKTKLVSDKPGPR